MASSARIDDLRKKFEENPRRYFAPLANEYRKAGEIEQAISICREYLPQQPGHMSGHIVFGQALYEARLFDESKTVFETALTLDPENLIALRHLGDIALLVGDHDAARAWYKRVLDADPRNEEIQSQIALLDHAGPSGAATTTETPIADPGKTPLSSTVVEQKAVPRPAPQGSQAVVEQPAVQRPAPSPSAPTVVAAAIPRPGTPKREEPVTRPIEAKAEAAGPSVEVPAAGTSDIGLEPTSMAASAPLPPAANSGLVLESSLAGRTDGPPIESFSLEGLETTSLAAPPPPVASPPAPVIPPPPPAPAAPAATAPEVASGLPDLDFGDTPAPPPAPAAAAPAPAPPAPPTVDLDFSSQSTTTVPAVSTPPAAPAPAPATVDLEFLTPEPALPATPAAPAPMELELSSTTSPLDTATSQVPPPTQALPMLDADVPAAPAAAAPAPPPAQPSVEPFMTETMAELYLKQGHHEKALEVYRAVLAQRPNDAALRARVTSLEAELLPPPVPAAAPTAVYHGPSIREVLGVIAARRPGNRAASSTNGGTGVAAPSAPTPAPTRSASVAGDALTALVSGAQPAASDETAANILYAAFTSNGDGAAAEALPGQPARPASGELSLDSVFSNMAPNTAQQSQDFALNQYFSQRAHGEPGTGGSRDARNESPEEVAKFTQWLEGLKRR